MGIMKHLPTIGRVFTPAAMLVFLTYEIVGSQEVSGGWVWAVTIGAALTAVGVEAVGIMAGHTLEGYWRMGDKLRTAVFFLAAGRIRGCRSIHPKRQQCFASDTYYCRSRLFSGRSCSVVGN